MVRGIVVSSRNIGNADGSERGTTYRVRVEQTFKGRPPKVIPYVTDRDSGGFYLGERGDSREYLLFLNPIGKDDWAQKDAPGAYRVNYSCGQSRQWKDVRNEDRNRLNDRAAQDHFN